MRRWHILQFHHQLITSSGLATASNVKDKVQGFRLLRYVIVFWWPNKKQHAEGNYDASTRAGTDIVANRHIYIYIYIYIYIHAIDQILSEPIIWWLSFLILNSFMIFSVLWVCSCLVTKPSLRRPTCMIVNHQLLLLKPICVSFESVLFVDIYVILYKLIIIYIISILESWLFNHPQL